MGKSTTKNSETPRRRPALSPEARENQLIAAAIDLAEQQILDGTASSQVITHFLKLGSMKERAELEKIKKENKLLEAKTEVLQSTARMEELYSNAMNAFKTYSGHEDIE